MLAESAARYVERGYDDTARAAALARPDRCVPERWREIAGLGWLGLGIPEDCGGFGGGAPELVRIAEPLGRALVVEPFIGCAVLAAPLASHLADAALRDEWCSALIAGDRRLALAAWEPAGRFDASAVATSATRAGGGVRLSGRKTLVLGGGAADGFVVLARDAGAAAGRAALGAYLVPVDARGLTVRPFATYAGAGAAEVTLDEVTVDGACRIGPEGDAWPLVEQAIDRATVVLAAEVSGAMAFALETTIDYLKTRRQFGRALAGNQALQHRLVDLYVSIEETRALARAAAEVVESGDATMRRRYASAAKARANQAARRTAEDTVQLHGAIGMTEEYVLGRYVRYLGAMQTLFGDTAWHLERVADERHPIGAER